MNNVVDYKAFFEKYAEDKYFCNDGITRKIQGASPTEEERYQAYEARILAKLQVPKVSDWGFWNDNAR